jgi:hypothetical protein
VGCPLGGGALGRWIVDREHGLDGVEVGGRRGGV